MKYNKQKVNACVAANLKRLRRERDYKSASKFAQTHQLAVQTYLNHESGKRALTLANMLEYAYLLQVHYAHLLHGVEHCLHDRKTK